MVRMVIIDWDGTAVASLYPYYYSVVKAFRACGKRPPSMNIFRDKISSGITGFYDEYGLTQKLGLPEIQRIRDKHIKKHWKDIKPNRGLRIFLSTCKTTGIPVVVLSANEDGIIRRRAQELDLLHFIGDIVTTTGSDNGNKEDALKMILKRHRDNGAANPEEVLFVDDTKEGIILAKKFGLATVAFTNGYNTLKKLMRSEPMFPNKMFKSRDFQDILKILMHLRNR